MIDRRISRPHPFDERGRQVLAPSIGLFTAAERKRVPRALAELAERFDAVIRGAPAPFEWLRDALSERLRVIECARFDDREYWHLRFGDRSADSLTGACFGLDAESEGPTPAVVPRPLAWLRETFGTIGLVAEQSGTAPFGRTFTEISAREREAQAATTAALSGYSGFAAFEPHDRFAGLPPEAADWVSLYEADGDWVFADVAGGTTSWVGQEWGPDSRFAVPWTRAAPFILRRLLEGDHVRPDDLRALEPR